MKINLSGSNIKSSGKKIKSSEEEINLSEEEVNIFLLLGTGGFRKGKLSVQRIVGDILLRDFLPSLN